MTSCSRYLFLRFYLHQKMEVIFHQRPCIRFCYGGNVFIVQVQKVFVVFVFSKNVATVNSPVVDMVEMFVC